MGPDRRGYSIVFAMNIRRFAGLSLLAILAGCNQTDKPADLGITSDPSGVQTATQQQTGTAVVQGSCPQVYLRDGTSVLRRYAKGSKDDPQNLSYQVTLADTTRQCVLNENQLVMTIMVQGRIVTGPAGAASGTVNVPIRVAASDGSNTLYTDLVQFPVTIPADGTAQFVFTKNDVAIPGGSGGFVRAYVGFDEGPYNTK